jgi:multiple sugar transport system substrate-binding protein
MKLLKTATLAIAAISLATAVSAQDAAINVLAHKVHQSVSTGLTAGTTGGDVTAEWQAKNGPINWITADVTPLHDRLFREMTLGTGNISLAFFLNRFASPKVFDQLEPLDSYEAANPIEDFEGLSKGMRDGMTYQGHLYGIPFRHATNALIYNEQLLKEGGFDGPPKTMAELVDMAKKLHHTDANGQEVFGLANHSGDSPTFILNMMLASGKPFLENDYTLNANTPEFIATLNTLKDLYDSGGLINDYVTSNLDGIISDLQNGRAVMTINPFGREAVLNDPKLSRFPGAFKVTPVPAGADGAIPAQTEVWYLVIPKNSPNKELAWDLIRTLSSPEATVREALNGNGATRPGAYEDPRIIAAIPTAAAQASSVGSAHLALPGFEEATRAQAILSEEADAFLLGQQTAEDAAAHIQARIEPLLPKKQ